MILSPTVPLIVSGPIWKTGLDSSLLLKEHAVSLELVTAAPGCSLLSMGKGFHLGGGPVLPGSAVPRMSRPPKTTAGLTRDLQAPFGS